MCILYKNNFLLIGVCHCAELILIEFLYPRIELDICHIIVIVLSWMVFWVCFHIILMPLNQHGWMIHLSISDKTDYSCLEVQKHLQWEVKNTHNIPYLFIKDVLYCR